MCQWIELAKQRPPIVRLGQTDNVLVAYYPAPDTDLYITMAFYDEGGKDSGWLEKTTFEKLPAPRYWMPVPPLPDASCPVRVYEATGECYPLGTIVYSADQITIDEQTPVPGAG